MAWGAWGGTLASEQDPGAEKKGDAGKPGFGDDGARDGYGAIDHFGWDVEEVRVAV